MTKENSHSNLDRISGALLLAAALLALIAANSPLSFAYDNLLHVVADVSIGDFIIKKPILLWINDGLMAIYFLFIGLEIKREIKHGVLSNKTSVIVPAITAFCGLLVPALIFISLNYHNPIYLKGWAIPTATDIAFTLAIMSLLSSRVPISLKVLLMAIAIFDDIGAIVIIAIFYTKKLSFFSLCLASLFTLVLFLLNYYQSRRVSLYMVIGIALWVAVLKSGVHATLAGIVIAMSIPDHPKNSMLSFLEDGLRPWIIFFILPVFAFANAGVGFSSFSFDMLSHPIVLGIFLGLFIGKQLGIFLPLWYFVRRKRFLSADNVSLKQIYGLALLCGVGFTMSLFIGSLAYQDTVKLLDLVKLSVLAASTLAGSLGYCVLRRVSPKISHE